MTANVTRRVLRNHKVYFFIIDSNILYQNFEHFQSPNKSVQGVKIIFLAF